MSDSEWAKAAVLDTCYLDRGRLNTGHIERLAAGLAARGAELWIPEVVVLEFAVHAREDLISQRHTHTKLRQAGLADNKPVANLTSTQVSDKLLKTCADIPSVTIIKLTGKSAEAGLRDQILGTGAGSVKDGVRTGAADSAWVRGALDKADNDPHSIVFLSNNGKDILRAAEALGHPKNTIRVATPGEDQEAMLDKYFGPAEPAPTPPAPAELVEPLMVLTTIARSLRDDYQATRNAHDQHGPPPEWIEIGAVSIGRNHDWGDDDEIETMMDPEAEVEPGAELVDVRVTDVYAANEDGTGVMVDYTVRLLADVRVEGQKINNDGEGYFDWVVLRDRLLTVPYTAELRDGALVDITQTDTATNDTAAPRFDDNYDAYRWLYTEELTTWKYITVHPLDSDTDMPMYFELRGPSDRVEKAELVPRDFLEDWALEFETLGVNISATYDHTARVSLGRGESFDAFRPASLHSESQRERWAAAREPYSALAELWAYLMGLSEAK